jgi:hypothetical protein
MKGAPRQLKQVSPTTHTPPLSAHASWISASNNSVKGTNARLWGFGTFGITMAAINQITPQQPAGVDS